MAVLLLAAFLYVVNGYAQDGKLYFENYSSQQGLSQNSCYSIAQDDNGYMWFGTQDGLNRYDGKEFRVFLPQSAIGRKLPSNYISSLFFDHHKKLLWIGTIRGACIYNSSGDSLVSMTELYPFAALLETVAVKKIVSFRENEYWVVSFNKGLLLLNTATRTLSSFFDDDNRARVNDVVLHDGKIIAALFNELIYMRPSGKSYQPEPLYTGFIFPEIKELFSFENALWIGTLSKGCYRIVDPIAKTANVQALDIDIAGVGCFANDRLGNIWIGTRGNGVIRYNTQTGAVQTASHDKYDDRSLGKNFVLSLFCDRQGIIWCGVSGNGVAKYDRLSYQFGSINNEPSKPSSLPDNMIFDIYKCRDNTYYIGTQNKGIAEWNRQENKCVLYPESSKFGPSNNTIYDIAEDEHNNLWIASWGGLMQLNRGSGKISYKESSLPYSKKLYAIVKLKNADSLFIASETGPVFYSLRDKQWRLCPDSVLQTASFTTGRWSLMTGRYIYEGPGNDLWICTVGAGLVKYNYKTQHFEVIESIKEVSIYARHLFADGDRLWVATDNGVVVYDHKKNKIIRQVLPGNTDVSKVCYAIQKDQEGFFWVSTNIGLFKIHPETFEVQKHYNLGNGLRFLEYNTACTFADTSGILMFGGVGGITQFNPLLFKQNSFSPVPLITSIRVNDKPWPVQANPDLVNTLSFTHRQNFLTIYFAVNNFSNEQNNQFSYRLRGLNDLWSAASTSNVASFTSLPPGDYVFELKSANSDGKWSDDIKTLAITIHPPWWKTWWFLAGLLILLTGGVTLAVRKRITDIRKDAALKQKITETEMMALRTQMNPHFIFNSLNSIREMILNNENKDASHYLSKFAHLMRVTLDQSSQSFISLNSTIDYLNRYIEMEQIRNNQFTYHISVDKHLNVNETLLPPMLIQPFIENAIWHGNELGNKKININIEFRKEDNQLVCIVDDNGIGIDQSLKNKEKVLNGHKPVGISNIKNRLGLLNEENKQQSSVVIEDKKRELTNDESGTRVTLRLPFETTVE